jgi:hypothetical protein
MGFGEIRFGIAAHAESYNMERTGLTVVEGTQGRKMIPTYLELVRKRTVLRINPMDNIQNSRGRNQET